MREDIMMYDRMIAAGWSPQYSNSDKTFKRILPGETPQDAVAYIKGKMRIWMTRHGWQVAELSHDSVYHNHRGSMTKPFKGDRYKNGFIPDLDTVLELDKKGEL